MELWWGTSLVTFPFSPLQRQKVKLGFWTGITVALTKVADSENEAPARPPPPPLSQPPGPLQSPPPRVRHQIQRKSSSRNRQRPFICRRSRQSYPPNWRERLSTPPPRSHLQSRQHPPITTLHGILLLLRWSLHGSLWLPRNTKRNDYSFRSLRNP